MVANAVCWMCRWMMDMHRFEYSKKTCLCVLTIFFYTFKFVIFFVNIFIGWKFSLITIYNIPGIDNPCMMCNDNFWLKRYMYQLNDRNAKSLSSGIYIDKLSFIWKYKIKLLNILNKSLNQPLVCLLFVRLAGDHFHHSSSASLSFLNAVTFLSPFLLTVSLSACCLLSAVICQLLISSNSLNFLHSRSEFRLLLTQ